jgi:hypothetical protein
VTRVALLGCAVLTISGLGLCANGGAARRSVMRPDPAGFATLRVCLFDHGFSPGRFGPKILPSDWTGDSRSLDVEGGSGSYALLAVGVRWQDAEAARKRMLRALIVLEPGDKSLRVFVTRRGRIASMWSDAPTVRERSSLDRCVRRIVSQFP